jgi:thymidine kinase
MKYKKLNVFVIVEKKSIFNVKITDSKIETTGTQIEIGDTNYISLCRKCFKEKKISKS